MPSKRAEVSAQAAVQTHSHNTRQREGALKSYGDVGLPCTKMPSSSPHCKAQHSLLGSPFRQETESYDKAGVPQPSSLDAALFPHLPAQCKSHLWPGEGCHLQRAARSSCSPGLPLLSTKPPNRQPS